MPSMDDTELFIPCSSSFPVDPFDSSIPLDELLGDVVAAGLGLAHQDISEPWSPVNDNLPSAPSSCLVPQQDTDAMPPLSPAVMLGADHVEAECMLFPPLGGISGAGMALGSTSIWDTPAIQDVMDAGLGLPCQDIGEHWSVLDDIVPSALQSCLQQDVDAMPPPSPAVMVGADHVATEAPCMLLSSLGGISGAEMPPNVTVTVAKRMDLQKAGLGVATHTLGSNTEDKPLNIQARDLEPQNLKPFSTCRPQGGPPRADKKRRRAASPCLPAPPEAQHGERQQPPRKRHKQQGDNPLQLQAMLEAERPPASSKKATKKRQLERTASEDGADLWGAGPRKRLRPSFQDFHHGTVPRRWGAKKPRRMRTKRPDALPQQQLRAGAQRKRKLIAKLNQQLDKFERSTSERDAALGALRQVIELQPEAAARAPRLEGFMLLMRKRSLSGPPGARAGPRGGAVPRQGAAAGCGACAPGGPAQGSRGVPVPNGIVRGGPRAMPLNGQQAAEVAAAALAASGGDASLAMAQLMVTACSACPGLQP